MCWRKKKKISLFNLIGCHCQVTLWPRANFYDTSSYFPCVHRMKGRKYVRTNLLWLNENSNASLHINLLYFLGNVIQEDSVLGGLGVPAVRMDNVIKYNNEVAK